jgi:hypothetical protein
VAKIDICGGNKARLEVAHQPHPGTRLTATVAPFRAWRGLQIIIARGPMSHHCGLLSQEARIINNLSELCKFKINQMHLVIGKLVSINKQFQHLKRALKTNCLDQSFYIVFK